MAGHFKMGSNHTNLFKLKRRIWADKRAFVPLFTVVISVDAFHNGLLSLQEGGETSATTFATRQCDALAVAKSLEKGMSTMRLSDSNAAIRPVCDSR